jgi:hypothetical protein
MERDWIMLPARRHWITVPPIVSTFLIGAVFLSACASATIRWQPSLVSQVPDSTPVRFSAAQHEPPVRGRAVDWQRGRPRLITQRGDTVVVPASATLEVCLPGRAITHISRLIAT